MLNDGQSVSIDRGTISEYLYVTLEYPCAMDLII